MFLSPRIRWWGLRLKILVWTFVPTVIALVGVGLVSFYAFQTTTRYLLIERNREVVRLLASQVNSQMDEYVQTLLDLERISGFTGPDENSRQAILTQATDSLAIFDSGVVVTDEFGTVVAALPKHWDVLGEDWSSRSYFREVLRSMEPVYSDVVKDGPNGSEVIVIAVPVFGDQKQFLGMMAGMFRMGAENVSAFYGDIVRLRIGESEDAPMTVYLVDGNGRVMYHTSTERIGEDFSEQKGVKHFLAGDYVDEFARRQLVEPEFGGTAGAVRDRDRSGRDVVAYFAAVPGTSWGLVTEANWDGLMAYYRIYLVVQTMMFVLGVAVPALVVSFEVRRITEPIYRLKTATREVAAGNFGQEIQVRTGDELEDLGDQFNQMSRQLSRSYAELRDREERLDLVMQSTNDGIWDWDIPTGQIYYSPRWKAMLGYAEDEFTGSVDHWLGLIHPDDVQKATMAVADHLEHRPRLYRVEYRLRHKDGTYRWVLSQGILLLDEAGNPQRMVGAHTDITGAKIAEEELIEAYETMEERVKERTKYLAILNDFSALVNRSLDINQTLSNALDKTMEITGMEFGVAYRLEGDQEGQWLTPEEAALQDPDHLFLAPQVSRDLPEKLKGSFVRISLAGNGIKGILESEAPLILNVQASSIAPQIMKALQDAGVEQVVSLPLKVKGRLVGAIQLGTHRPKQFSPEELDLLGAIGQQVGVSAENARLHEAVQQSAALEERARLARDLHDSVTQSLFSVTLLAEAASRLLLAGDHQTAASHLRLLRDAAQESLREMRLLIYELRPVALEKSRLADAIRLRLEAVETRAGIKTDFRVEGTEDLSFEEKTELYQVTQETLNNILKHSHASNVEVHLQFFDGVTCLEVCDDGVGFEPSVAAQSGGLGLAGIAERAQKIGGKLKVDSAPGSGTRIRVEVATRAKPPRS